MVTIEELAQAALRRDSLELRSLVQDFLSNTPRFEALARPALSDPRLLTVAAALVELLATRREQAAPTWTADVGPLAEPFYLLAAAESMKRLRELCLTQAPEPLRKRRLYAPPDFLDFA